MSDLTGPWAPTPWTDSSGMVHRPIFSATRNTVIPIAQLLPVLVAAAEDPKATLEVMYDNRHMDDFWTLHYYNDQSDFYSI